MTLEDLLGSARFVGQMTDNGYEQRAWTKLLLSTAFRLRRRRLRLRRAHPFLGGGSLGDLAAALSPMGAGRFDCSDRRHLRALSNVAAVLAARIDEERQFLETAE